MNGGNCPADGTQLDCRDNVIENAMHLALQQSAGVLVVRDEDTGRELESRGGIAAVLRF
jgi:stalled ribosome rescue protein Dom34